MPITGNANACVVRHTPRRAHNVTPTCRRHQQIQRRFASNKPDAPPTSPDVPSPSKPLTLFRRTLAAASPYSTRLLAPLRAYGRAQQRTPYRTQLLTTSTIFTLGDLSAQSLDSQGFSSRPYEPARGLRAWFIGAGLSIPGYTWFMWLARNFNYPSSWVRSMGTKILIQQCVFLPLVQTYFFSMQILLSGGSLESARRRVIDTLPVSWTNSWKVWPAVMAFTFTYVPMQYRSVFNAFVGVCWQTYLSWVNQKAEAAEERTDAVQDLAVSGLSAAGQSG
ncbi:hypothetical protein LTR35_017077 [Friedmanniomyces endolithicus]|uniref:Protein SYM1 n=1 Tax=Friedmanniomyces endolithicus TaxID=329885 RepID=A0AAN6FJ58_9PEZI|nr:hypothetical protein LTR35_017077 [Friedmanniomyces endolithicus]KAK0295298.1 hypothetical protein LTS00_005928 [Friedmanniomyces endolithicus]KAK0317550.1 hypothetical protein LTR82_011589 [Friedmanniomyces endolithicus]KAK0983152.1 hypothetical protein LTR54_014407 [Friedmanniomyces endolithicus]